MIRILVVEDDAEKLRRVLQCIKQVHVDADTVNNARDATEAKRLLRDNDFDLLILDLALPIRSDEMPDPEGGIKLLDEVLQRDIYKKPREVVGLTAFPEMKEFAGARFAEDLWMVVQYDPTSDLWAEQLRRKVHHLLLAERSPGTPSFGSYLCVVTALADPELSAVLNLPWEWKTLEIPNDGTIYHRGHVKARGVLREIVAAAAPRMGMTAAAVLATKMIGTFRPRYLAMAGITAGIRDKCELGDIIAADPAWDWGSGKHYVHNGTAAFAAAPHQVGLSSFIRGKLSLMAQNGEELDSIRRSWKHGANTVLKLHVGPVASGSSVLQDPNIMETIKQQHRKVLGIEMESYGILVAAEESALPQPKGFSLKSVCDFADDDKNDDHHLYAAYTSAAALKLFIERYL